MVGMSIELFNLLDMFSACRVCVFLSLSPLSLSIAVFLLFLLCAKSLPTEGNHKGKYHYMLKI